MTRGSRPVVPALLLALALNGCVNLPRSGPSTMTLRQTADAQIADTGFSVLTVDAPVLDALGKVAPTTLSTLPTTARPEVDRLGIGDVLAVQVYEAGPGGLFSPIQSTTSALIGTGPGQFGRLVVDRDGKIFIPYAGTIEVAGRTPAEVQALISARLQGKAIRPQVVVMLASNASNTAMVGGLVKAPGRVPLTLAAEKISDVIALAGGSLREPQDCYVQLVRDGVARRVLLERVYNEPGENVFVQPNDQLQLVTRARSFTVFGATQKSGEIAFESTRLTLAQALARAGGLSDERADPSGIYLFRFELPQAAAELNLPGKPQPNGTVPVIYRVDLSRPDGFFIAQQFEMRESDVLYVPNATLSDVSKFTVFLRTFTSLAYDVRAVQYFSQ